MDLDSTILARSRLAMMEYSKATSVMVSMGGMVQGWMPYRSSSTCQTPVSSLRRNCVYYTVKKVSGFPAGMSLTKISMGGSNLIIPAYGESGK